MTITQGPRHPEIHVTLVGLDGNAFSILARCERAMRVAGLSGSERGAFMAAATSGDYDALLRTAMEWFAVDCDATDGAE